MKFSTKFSFFILLALFFIIPFHYSFAETDINGDEISENTTWTVDAGPYIIYQSPTVDANVTLTIEPGTIVKFDYGQSLNIFGTLTAEGAADNRISFTSLYDTGDDSSTAYYGDWQGINVSAGGNYDLKNVQIAYAVTAIVSNAAVGTLDTISVLHSQTGFVLQNGSSADIQNLDMQDILANGIVLLASTASVRSSDMKDIYSPRGGGIYVLNGSNLDFKNSTTENISGPTFLLYQNSTSSVTSSHISNSAGMEIYANSYLDFKNSDMKNISGTAFDIMGNSSVNINDSIFDSIDSAVEIYDVSSLNVINVTITNILNNYNPAFSFYTNSTVNISNSDIENIAAGGFAIYGGSTLDFSSSTLAYIGKQAFQIYDNNQGSATTTVAISYSIINNGENNGFEIYGAVNMNINNSTISNFLGDGMQVYSDPVAIHISTSTISANNNAIENWGDGFPVIAAENNWWGDISGPFNTDANASGTANSVSDNVDFTPWLTHDPKIKRNPVIIIPGIGSSYLDTSDGTEVWPNVLGALKSPEDTYLDQLTIAQSGKPDSNRPVISIPDILRKVEFGVPFITLYKKDFFDGLINQLESEGYVQGQDLFVFPYDWRLDIRDDMPALASKIEAIREQTGAAKVDIIAHSMGGLLAKEYIKNYGHGDVNTFIDIATPQLGAPYAMKILMSGDDMGIELGPFGLNLSEVQKITQNMPSVYQLLPSAGYFSSTSADYKYYIDDISDFDGDGVTGRLTYDQSNQFLKNSGRNATVLDSAVTLHDDIDTMNPADYGVQTYNIVGCGTPTFGKFFALGKESQKDPEFGGAFISGDDTVPTRSAEAIPAIGEYYDDKGADHGTLPSANGVKELVASLLSGTQSSFDFTTYGNIATTSAKCTLPNGKVLMFHSPVDVNIYDAQGDHTGPNASGTVEYNVPDIGYEIFENNKFVYLPDGEDYKVELDATDIGSFSSHIQTVVNGDIVSTEYFNDIPLQNIHTKAEVDLSDDTSTIALDSAGDGISIKTIDPSSEISGDSLSDESAPTTTIEIIAPLSISGDGILHDAQISLNATDTDSGVLKTEYSFDGNTWTLYDGQTIQTDQKNIEYYSVDNAGNIEAIQTTIIPTETAQSSNQNPPTIPSANIPNSGSVSYWQPRSAISTTSMYTPYISAIGIAVARIVDPLPMDKVVENPTTKIILKSTQTDSEASALDSNQGSNPYLILITISLLCGLYFVGRKYITR